MNQRIQRTQGFTIIELVIATVIASILLVIAFTGTRGLLERQRVAEATSQVAQDIELLRSTAAKTSRPARLTFNPSNPGQYTISYWRGDRQVNQVVNLPYAAKMTLDGTRNAAGELELAYQAPYAELAAPNRTITITPANGNSALTKNIFVVGVTGQVHQ